MFVNKMFLMSAMIVSLNSMAHAGWVSGGGGITKDAGNPWFLSNVSTVQYCIEIDQANFSLPLSEVKHRVKQGLDFWKAEFAGATPMDAVTVGGQNFVETTCDKPVDLRFQFGVLSADQMNYLNNPKKFIGVAVRTDYDNVHMKGKGFIYISPDRGPLRFDISATRKNVWNIGDGTLLKWIVIHELGHVFGIPHDESLIMEELFPMELVEEVAQSGHAIDENFHPSYFIQDLVVDDYVCPPPATYKRFFDFTTENECGRILFGPDLNFKVFSLNAYDPDHRDEVLVGSAKLTKHTPSNASMGIAVKVWLPDEQQLFPKDEEYFLNYARLYERERMAVFTGQYESVSGVKRPFMITISGSMMLAGVMDGVLYPDLEVDDAVNSK